MSPGELSGPPVAGVILAAGASRRMGKPKQLLEFRGVTLLRRVAAEAVQSSLARVLVVLGAHAPVASAVLKGLSVEILEHPGWARGQGSSAAAGLRALRQGATDTGAVVFLLSDQPLVTAVSIDLLIKTHRATGALIVAARHQDRLETPALFSFAFFDELCSLDDDAGIREILRHNEIRAIGLDLHGAGLDIDTPDDYDQLIALGNGEVR